MPCSAPARRTIQCSTPCGSGFLSTRESVENVESVEEPRLSRGGRFLGLIEEQLEVCDPNGDSSRRRGLPRQLAQRKVVDAEETKCGMNVIGFFMDFSADEGEGDAVLDIRVACGRR